MPASSRLVHSAHRMLPALFLGLLAACAGGGGDAGSAGGGAAAGGMPSLDACAVLREVDIAGLIGVAPDTLIEVLNRTEGSMAAAQCVAASSSSPASVGLLVRYSARGGNPATREEWMAREVEANVANLGQEAADAIRAAEDVPGLGDMALAYEMIGANLAVFWDGGRYQLVATSSDVPDPAAARRALEAIARKTLERY